jgi:thymidylate synthase
MKAYLDLLRTVMETGNDREDRTGTGTRGIFGHQMRIDLSTGEFPLVTTKKTHFPSIAHELLWLISGDTNIKYLTDHKVTIWNEWADENGDLGPVYGYQWRKWTGKNGKQVDQLQGAISDLKNKPESRRIIVSAWNPGDIPEMRLPPCHCFYHFYTRNVGVRKFLDCLMYIRSNDLFLGAPFNIASYSLLTMMVAQVVGREPGELIYTIGDAHIYKNHFEQVKTQLSRTPYALPKVKINPDVKDIDGFVYDDLVLDGYVCHPAIRAPVAV